MEHFSIMFNNNKFDNLYLEQCIIENNTDALKEFFTNKEGHNVIEKVMRAQNKWFNPEKIDEAKIW